MLSLVRCFPQYLQTGEQMGARTFNLPPDVYNAMSLEQQWAANQSFLDQAISRGSEIRLSTPAGATQEGSTYERELQYLQS
jgi:hypothetical protein